ncbi:MAG: segregation/condensation protein A [candidate division KSB1 bacterium]|nr:segregation/condensation protein A [candidate division KSB1 bacterium]MDZ7301009.1 segregation/condensation protein A [candidate division KSB1 bacterium]MDZ7310312.1 segregation/condensation protein A [candidate division KSB1 bacterium]
MPYRVKLTNFEGPLDLLLFLIKKNEVDIYDIPIAEITQQYLEYVAILQMLDLEGAGDFILLAATLIRIKAQMLLPRPPEESEEEEEDPRQELVRRLLEYQRYKEVAGHLAEFEVHERDFFPRGHLELNLDGYDFSDWATDGGAAGTVSLFDLMTVFKQVLMRVPKEIQHKVENIPVSVEEQIEYILQELHINKQLLFMTLLQRLPSKIYIIVTFIALLEMIKRGMAVATQSGPFGEIWISRI